MKRREMLKMPVALSLMHMAFLPDRAEAQFDPVTLSIVLGLISAGGIVLSAKVAADKNKESQIEVAQMQFAMQRMQQEFEIKKMKFQIGQINVFDEMVYDKRGEYANILLSSNVDNHGTEFGVQGRLASRRGQYAGDFYSVEAAKFSKGIEMGETMPVPVEQSYRSVSPAQVKQMANEFERNQFPIAMRRYSSARNPTERGWDLATVLYANSNNSVDAKIFQRKT